FALSALTLMAFVGGSHWWLISASPVLILIFAITGCILPATLLHFFLTYPFPAPLFSQDRRLSRFLLYVLPGIAALALSLMILAAILLTRNFGPRPFAETGERITGEFAALIFPALRRCIYLVLTMSVVYFLCSLLALRRSYLAARSPIERNQVKSLMSAGL